MKLSSFAAALSLCLMTTPSALAQTETHNGAVIAYEPAFFATYNPVTARDMVAQVPGFSMQNGADVRGLADTFANVLIDGERQSTKSESITDILGRIPVSSVVRVELVREAVPGIDMRGQNRVVNVVLVEESARTTTLNGGFDYWVGSGTVTPLLRASSTWDIGDTRVTLGGLYGQNQAPRLRSESLLSPDGGVLELRDERTSVDYVQSSLNGSVSHRFEDGARLDVNASALLLDVGLNDRSRVVDGGGDLDRVELFTSDGEELSWEFGGTYERPFTERWSGQLTVLNRGEEDRFDDVFTGYAPDGSAQATFYANDVTGGEHVLRGTVTHERNARHSFEFGLEGAFNYLENGLAIAVDDGSGPVPLDLPVANTRVEERRGEVFASHVWKPTDTLTLESGLRIERSEISQSGDASRERQFTYPKPRVSLTWNASEDTQWQFTLERTVAQLSFGEFASEVDPREDQVLIGNPELVPQQAWVAQARWERRWGETASLAFTLAHEEITDVGDYRPVFLENPDGSVSVLDAPGNIGDGSITYLQSDATVPLDRFGLDNARLDLSVMLRDSRVTDPTTGETRRLNRLETWRVEADFRQDFPERDMAWGWSLYHQGEEDTFRFDNVMVFEREEPELEVFVETTAIDGVTMRLVWIDILSTTHERERSFYQGSRADTPLAATEYRQEELGGIVAFRVSSTF